MEKITSRQQQAIHLVYVKRMTESQASRALGCSPQNIHKLLKKSGVLDRIGLPHVGKVKDYELKDLMGAKEDG